MAAREPLTQTELLFMAAAGDEPDGGVAVLEAADFAPTELEYPAPHFSGPASHWRSPEFRSALVPAECPHNFPDVDNRGGNLLRVWGPFTHGWNAEYSVPTPEVTLCWYCDKPVVATTSTGDGSTDEKPGTSYSIIALKSDPRLNVIRPAHPLCATEAAGLKVTAMATYHVTKRLPDCRECGLPYEDHGSTVTSIWDAFCDDEFTRFWRPSAPFRSRNWPFRLIVESPRYTGDGKIGFGETEEEAIARLHQEANAA